MRPAVFADTTSPGWTGLDPGHVAGSMRPGLALGLYGGGWFFSYWGHSKAQPAQPDLGSHSGGDIGVERTWPGVRWAAYGQGPVEAEAVVVCGDDVRPARIPRPVPPGPARSCCAQRAAPPRLDLARWPGTPGGLAQRPGPRGAAEMLRGEVPAPASAGGIKRVAEWPSSPRRGPRHVAVGVAARPGQAAVLGATSRKATSTRTGAHCGAMAEHRAAVQARPIRHGTHWRQGSPGR